jgi:hypothetical protein
LQQAEIFQSLRLVGGTSLALQIGHRKSVDIDLFGSLTADLYEIGSVLSEAGDVKVLQQSENIHIYLVNQVKTDIVNYTYPWIDEMLVLDNLRLAGLKDIAAMKMAAISGRGSKKDFVDIHFLLQMMSLKDMLHHYCAKFSDGSLFLVLKSLVYFEDAEEEPMPEMLMPVNWDEVKRSIRNAHTDFMKGSGHA